MKYAVMVEFDEDEWMFLTHDNPSIEHASPVRLFDTKQDAWAAAKAFNNPQIVVWSQPRDCPSCREPLSGPAGDGCALLARHKE